MSRSILVKEGEVTKDTGFLYICSGYLVESGRVLLVHHKGFDKWVPPGGHIEPGETFSQTAVREFREETGLRVKALSSQTYINSQDSNAIPEPTPFYVDVEYNSFAKPAIVQFYYVKREGRAEELHAQASEVHDVAWFALSELDTLPTFEQVRSVAKHALNNYPVEIERASE
ncbi:NUDIX hydrolase [Amycolatopsis tolypomycina]|uniref:NUDIX hydrolase n=1 Tax=Amycolatopsis tolypomycina TaxID=208445 RepID=UPI0033B009F4